MVVIRRIAAERDGGIAESAEIRNLGPKTDKRQSRAVLLCTTMSIFLPFRDAS